jgi:hypothetical protein
LLVVPALNDVDRQSSGLKAGLARHTRNLFLLISSLFQWGCTFIPFLHSIKFIPFKSIDWCIYPVLRRQPETKKKARKEIAIAIAGPGAAGVHPPGKRMNNQPIRS